jgi:hypothetical protein
LILIPNPEKEATPPGKTKKIFPNKKLSRKRNK